MDRMEYKINSCLEDVSALLDEIKVRWVKAGLDEETLFALRLGLGEALTNAVKHGNGSDKQLEVRVTCLISSDSVELEVIDEGKGFNYNLFLDPTTEERVLAPGGRGIFLIRNVMDNVEFHEGGSRIKMIRHLSGDRPPVPAG